MRRFLPFSAALLCLVASAPGRTADSEGTAAASAPASQPVRMLGDTMAKRVGAIAALAPDADAEREIRGRRRQIRERLQATDEAEERVAVSLGWANWELAEAASAAATRWMTGFRTREDLAQFGEIARHAHEALDAAKMSLDSVPAATDAPTKKRLSRWRETLTTLGIFAEGYEALSRAVPSPGTDPGPAQEACRGAALGLAELRENEDADTAAAAKLWQAALLEAGGRPAQSLTILDMPLSPPKRLPYEFFNHLLRCTILTNRGAHSLATGLALRMEQLCGRWFGNDASAPGQAKLTLRAIRASYLWQWADALRPAQPETAASQAKRADELVARSFPPGEKASIYRFRPAIPIFAEVPPPKEAATKPADEPARAATASSRAESRPARAPTTSQTGGEDEKPEEDRGPLPVPTAPLE